MYERCWPMTVLAIPVKGKISDLLWPLIIRGVAEGPAQSVRHQIDLHARHNDVTVKDKTSYA